MTLTAVNSAVKKAVIPVAGLGTRFLPATKSIPKEMLTVVDAPTILYVIEEAVDAGVEDIILIQGRGKTSIEDFFDVSYELEDKLAKDGKTQSLERLNRIKNLANIISIRQKQALGLGHAVACARSVVGNDSFAVLLGDEIMVSEPGQKNVTRQLVECYNQTNTSTVAVMKVADEDVSKYGIAEILDDINGYFQVKGLVEKPKATETSSRWALPGRYVFGPEIFGFLAETRPGKNGEIQLTDAMAQMLQKFGMKAVSVKSSRYDAGDPFGFIRANVELALRHPVIGEQVKKYLQNLVNGCL
jgi:UTP--glucose-1-phosphate uridylyltransferase